MASAVSDGVPVLRDPATDDRAAIARWETTVAALADPTVVVARPQVAPPPAAVEADRIRSRLEREMGIDALVAKLGSGRTPPVAPEPAPVDRLEILADSAKSVLAGISPFNLVARWKAEPELLAVADAAVESRRLEAERERADRQRSLDAEWQRLQALKADLESRTEREVELETDRRAAAAERAQSDLDLQWEALLRNDPDALSASLREASGTVPFELVRVEGETATAAVVVGTVESTVPERRTAVTPGGRPSTKKRTKTERNEAYLRLVANVATNVGRRVIARAPGLEAVDVLVRRGASPIGAESIALARIDRPLLASMPDGPSDSSGTLLAAGSLDVEIKGRTRELAPLTGEAAERAGTPRPG